MTKKIKRLIIHIIGKRGRWRLHIDKRSRRPCLIVKQFSQYGSHTSWRNRNFTNKEDAIDHARYWAKNDQPSQIFVHRSDGVIQREWTYGNDPKKRKG